MKKLLFLIPLLISCASNSSSSMISSQVSEESLISEDFSLEESSLTSLSQEDELQLFIDNLSSLDTNVNQVNVQSMRTNYYLSDSFPLTITMKNDYVTNRYGGDEPLNETKGHISFIDEGIETSKEGYTIHLFHDVRTFYRISDYEGSTVDQKEVIPYVEEYEEENFSLAYTTLEIKNFKEMKKMLSNDYYYVEYQGINDFKTEGEFYYAYRLTLYEDDFATPSQVIIYNNKLIFENNQIISSEVQYANELYAGGIKTNWVIVETKTNYSYGEYPLFEGERLNPANYK